MESAEEEEEEVVAAAKRRGGGASERDVSDVVCAPKITPKFRWVWVGKKYNISLFGFGFILTSPSVDGFKNNFCV